VKEQVQTVLSLFCEYKRQGEKVEPLTISLTFSYSSYRLWLVLLQIGAFDLRSVGDFAAQYTLCAVIISVPASKPEGKGDISDKFPNP
jgi:hypothetical protein